jgi:hypothetical protein
MTEQLSHALTEATMRDCLCAACWGPLVKRPGPGRDWLVSCASDADHAGFVTKHWVARQRDADAVNSIDAGRMLRKVGVIPDPNKGKTEADLLREMGY